MSNTSLRPFAFLGLPSEVRLRIYTILFANAELYIVDGAVELQRSSGPLAICLTNREIYYEAIDELYSSLTLTYEQISRNVGPGDAPLAPNCRRLIPNLVLVRKCHWTQFRLNWSMLRGYSNLQSLTLKDDSIFIYSNCDTNDDLHTDIPDILNGVVDIDLVGIIEDTLYDAQIQPLPMIKSGGFNALRDRARPFWMEYHKKGALIDVRNDHVMMDIGYDADTRTLCHRSAVYKSAAQMDRYWANRGVPPPNLQHIHRGRARNW